LKRGEVKGEKVKNGKLNSEYTLERGQRGREKEWTREREGGRERRLTRVEILILILHSIYFNGRESAYNVGISALLIYEYVMAFGFRGA
jgi:Membrane carboxypeptidase/penicillin-binding protein